jgi:hypothetical protein
MGNYFKSIVFLFACSFLMMVSGILKGQEFSLSSNPIIKDSTVRTYLTSSVPIGNGKGQAWIAVDSVGNTCAVGINFTEDALENLPGKEAEYSLQLPEVGKHFFTHATIDWNPHGHEPQGVYSIPHFDFHFYIIPEKQRLTIGPKDSLQFAKAPDVQFFPANYILAPGGVEKMGAHWIDQTSPEFSGKPFTKTFIWGSYDGNIIFWEPMISRDYLLTHPHDVVNLTQPKYFQKDGWYANGYQIIYWPDSKTYTIALTDLVFRKGK